MQLGMFVLYPEIIQQNRLFYQRLADFKDMANYTYTHPEIKQ